MTTELTEYPIGAPVTVDAQFRDDAGKPYRPNLVKLRFKYGDGSKGKIPRKDIRRTALGDYVYEHVATIAGPTSYRWEGFGGGDGKMRPLIGAFKVIDDDTALPLEPSEPHA